MDRKAFKKEMKEYEKRLMKRAKLGDLSLPEKEEYERICRNRHRNRHLRLEKWQGFFGSVVLAVIVLGGSYYVNNLKPNNQEGGVATRQDISMEPWIGQKNELVNEVNRITQSLNEQNTLMNEAIERYNTDRVLPETYEKQLMGMTVSSEEEELTTLVSIHNQYLSEGQQLLVYLKETPQIDVQYTESLCQDLRNLTEAYKSECEKIKD